MPVELISTVEQLAALETSWNAIACNHPFRSWDWLATWWTHYSGARRRNADDADDGNSGRQLYVLAVYQDAKSEHERELIGLAPWYLDRTLVKGSVLRWLGSGEVCSDHLSLICRSEHRERVAAEIANALTTSLDDWNRLDLRAIDAGDEAIEWLVRELESRDCLVSRQPADACWSLALPASWDEYLGGISKSHRKQLRQLERRVLESDRAVWHRCSSAADFDSAWNVLVDLHQRRRRSLGEPGCFASHTFHDFHHEVAQRLLARGQLRLSWLALDGVPAAAEYHFSDDRATYAYQGGVDPDRLGEEPGRLSMILCLRAAIDEGHTTFDFMRGDEPYKAHWRAAARPTYDYRIVPNRRLARLRGRVLNLANITLTGIKSYARR
jgi:CelD/BcsL family acetyltransferase involved in cellulose biosynthesis